MHYFNGSLVMPLVSQTAEPIQDKTIVNDVMLKHS